MIFLSSNIIAFLNSRHAGDALIVCLSILALWSIAWRLFLGQWLYKHKVNSFWYAIYELGPVGSFAVILGLSIVFILLIASFQVLLEYGTKMIFALTTFWGTIIVSVIFFIKKIKK